MWLARPWLGGIETKLLLSLLTPWSFYQGGGGHGEADGGSQPRLELVRRERAGKLASWQARLRADRDFD